MKTDYNLGKIVVSGYLFEPVLYSVSTNALSVDFDGKGGISKLILCRDGKNYTDRTYLSIFIDGERVSDFSNKTVENIGRTQKVTISSNNSKIIIDAYAPLNESVILYEVNFENLDGKEINYCFDVGSYGFIPKFASSNEYEYEHENLTYYIKRKKQDSNIMRFIVGYGAEQTECDNALKNFDNLKNELFEEIINVKLPSSVKTEEDKAFYYSTFFCVKENYKDFGEFKGFMAGCNYINPMRTYFRDSYWTTLSMYENDVGLVKNQILTLARGIATDGTCPSAVKVDFSAFWGNHYDSPSFFVMMIYDYVNHTGDFSLLNQKVNGKTLFETAVSVIEKLITFTDGTGLIYKEGDYNKRDWADAVNRNGYVTYNELLYFRALYSISELCRVQGVDGTKYSNLSIKVKNSINEILWSEEKGYYVNYKTHDFCEDNLSIDTCLAILFNVVENENKEKLLNNFEKILETKNNKEQKAGDFGVCCVYPFYKGEKSLFSRSNQEFGYHNGSNWPYLSSIYAYAKYLSGREYEYALKSWFTQNLEKGNYTPVEYYSPTVKKGSNLQAWSGVGAFVLDRIGKKSFYDKEKI